MSDQESRINYMSLSGAFVEKGDKVYVLSTGTETSRIAPLGPGTYEGSGPPDEEDYPLLAAMNFPVPIITLDSGEKVYGFEVIWLPLTDKWQVDEVLGIASDEKANVATLRATYQAYLPNFIEAEITRLLDIVGMMATAWAMATEQQRAAAPITTPDPDDILPN